MLFDNKRYKILRVAPHGVCLAERGQGWERDCIGSCAEQGQ